MYPLELFRSVAAVGNSEILLFRMKLMSVAYGICCRRRRSMREVKKQSYPGLLYHRNTSITNNSVLPVAGPQLQKNE
jgi:hypothetical protein